MGAFNVKFTKANMNVFCNHYKIKAFNKELIYFKNYINLSCIDLYPTIYPKRFESTLIMVTDLSDIHKLIATALKVKYEKVSTKTMQ